MPLADRLRAAAGRLDTLTAPQLRQLLRSAATELEAAAAPGRAREHVPVYAYHLLRRLERGPVSIGLLHGIEDEGAVSFLVSRGLARVAGPALVITPAGGRVGEVEPESGSV